MSLEEKFLETYEYYVKNKKPFTITPETLKFLDQRNIQFLQVNNSIFKVKYLEIFFLKCFSKIVGAVFSMRFLHHAIGYTNTTTSPSMDPNLFHGQIIENGSAIGTYTTKAFPGTFTQIGCVFKTLFIQKAVEIIVEKGALVLFSNKEEQKNIDIIIRFKTF